MANINFKGKEIVRNHHLTIPYHELVPDAKKGLSKKPSLNDNLIIHGDNLLALKALLPTYAGKVKCIYIDPPYNIGNENWEYNDNVNSPMMREWFGKVVNKDDLTRHDKWLCMMMPRLKLLRELLSDDGVIFISIDDNEQHNLRGLLDDIFGAENFAAIFPWKKRSAKSDVPYGISQDYEWVICYAKNDFTAGLSIERKYYQTPDFPNDKWRLADLTTQKVEADRPNSAFNLVNPKTGKVYPYNPKRLWGITKDTFEDYYKRGKIVFPDDYDFLRITIPAYRVFESEDKLKALKKYGSEDAIKAVSTYLPKEVGMTEDGNKELIELFGEMIFPFPKPSSLIKHLISIINDNNCIILDSFAGSGTTAHAVLDLNKKDDGNRKFILVQLPEKIEKDRPAYKLGYREIVDITTERVRRVIRGVKTAKDENLKKGLGGSFSYFELGKPIDTERILKGKDLPTFTEMARYIFYTATGEEFNEKKVSEKTGLIGESKEYQVYLLYKPDMEYLKSTALTLERAEALGKFGGKKRLVFAPMKYLDQEHLERLHIDFAQLPFEIYQKQ